jgi:soluble lytic murein transglycosylase-like protein
MTNSPILRSAALQRALLTQPVRPSPASTSAFASTLTKVQARTTPPVVGATPPSTGGDVPFKDLIANAARKYGLRPELLAGLVKAESGFNPNAQSGVGAKGLTQLMDATARGLARCDQRIRPRAEH